MNFITLKTKKHTHNVTIGYNGRKIYESMFNVKKKSPPQLHSKTNKESSEKKNEFLQFRIQHS